MPRTFSNKFYEIPSNSCTDQRIERGHRNLDLWKWHQAYPKKFDHHLLCYSLLPLCITTMTMLADLKTWFFSYFRKVCFFLLFILYTIIKNEKIKKYLFPIIPKQKMDTNILILYFWKHKVLINILSRASRIFSLQNRSKEIFFIVS